MNINYITAGILLIGGLLSILSIGQERKPLTAKVAMFAMLINMVLAYFLIK